MKVIKKIIINVFMFISGILILMLIFISGMDMVETVKHPESESLVIRLLDIAAGHLFK